MTTAGVADNFAFRSVFLPGEGEYGKGCQAYGGDVGCGRGMSFIAKLEVDVHEAKWMCVRALWWLCMFARTKKEEEAKGG